MSSGLLLNLVCKEWINYHIYLNWRVNNFSDVPVSSPRRKKLWEVKILISLCPYPMLTNTTLKTITFGFNYTVKKRSYGSKSTTVWFQKIHKYVIYPFSNWFLDWKNERSDFKNTSSKIMMKSEKIIHDRGYKFSYAISVYVIVLSDAD